MKIHYIQKKIKSELKKYFSEDILLCYSCYMYLLGDGLWYGGFEYWRKLLKKGYRFELIPYPQTLEVTHKWKPGWCFHFVVGNLGNRSVKITASYREWFTTFYLPKPR